MCSISDIPFVGAVVNHISEAAVGAVSRGIRYILFYKDNVAKLNSEIKRLDALEQEIERQVEQAKNNGKKIKKHVSDWQDEVKKIKGEDEVKFLEEYGEVRFLEGYKGRTSWSCFNVLRCPNPYGRFQLGRWAAKKTTTVSDLEQKKPTGEFSYSPPKKHSPISSTEYQNFGSREAVYEKIFKALNYKEDGFPVVGIFGFGGVGKTRMMEKASKEVEEKGIFETVARANVGQKVDIGKIQDDLAPYLDITVKSEDRTSQLKARLSKGDTILVILDDVWSEISFAEIGIPFGDPSIKGCKILLTSRSRRVCILNKCEDPVEIEALTEDEAWGMFTKTIGDSTIKSVDESLARQVCNKCARLPLIISVVGKALQERDQPFWKDALSQLMNYKPENIDGIPPEAYDCLRLSFKILQKDAYVCLLLCSLAGEDEEIEIEFLFRLATGTGLLEYYGNTLEDARNRVDAMVSVLKSSSLLLEGRDYSSVKLHDIIRDVARSIIHDNESEYKFLSASNWPKVGVLRSRKLIYLDFKGDMFYFPDDLVCPDLHTLYLKSSNLSDVQLPDSFFESLPKLEYLLLDIESLSAMPSSIQNLDSLRSLTIHRCNVNDISHIIQLKNLEMLSVQDSCFGGPPLDLRQLGRLRMLDLRTCTEIMGIVLSPGLMCLEELYLPNYCNILDEETKRKIPLSSVPSKLTSLEIYFEDVKSCPDENFCKKLCRYDICVGVGVIQAREFEFFLKRDSTILKSVYFCNDSIGGGVKTLVERGEYVILERVTGLQKCFSQGGGAFKDLKRLNITECMGDEYLFCTSTARCLQQLEELVISGCKMMKEIIRNEGQINEIIDFPKLRDLRLLKLPVLKSLCKEVVFPALEVLHIRALDNMTEIWEEHGHLKEESFCQLTHLEVEGCHKLKNVIPYAMRQRLQNLKALSISNCEMMEEIVRNEGQINEIIDFPKLGHLTLHSLPVLKSLFCGKAVFPALELLFIRALDNITEIWEEHGHLKEESFCQLRYLEVSGCHKLKNVIPYAMCQRLQNLLGLKIVDCEMMEEIVRNEGQINEIIDFPKLQYLTLSSLPVLKSLFCGKAVFPVLKLLDIHELDNITEIWEEHGHLKEESFCQLRELDVGGCPKLKNVIPYAMRQRLQNLEELKIVDCEMMEEIVRNEGQINEIIDFSKLRDLELKSLPLLKSLFCGKVSFPSLETLIIIGVKINLEQIHIGSDYTSKLIKVVVSSESQAPQLIPPNWLLASRDLESLAVSNCHFHEWDLFRLLGNSSGKNNPYGTISFRRLQEVDVNLCTLSTIFTCSVAKGLQELEKLKVRSCGSIEEIVTDERRNDQLVVDACEEISFPKLRTVVLNDLSNLKSFCPSANYCFKMPSLEDVEITRCPQMLSFTPRQISTPKVRLTITHPSLDGEGYCESKRRITDINSYLHQIMNTQELFVDKKEELNLNHVDKGKSIVIG